MANDTKERILAAALEMFCKVLTLEQFRDDRARELATKQFLTGLTEIFTHIFAGIMD